MTVPKPVRSLSLDSLTVYIYASAEAVALTASQMATDILNQAIAQQGEAAAVFATGRSQLQCLQNLTQLKATELNWQQVTGFHLDEYLGIAADHPASFRQYLQQHLTNKVALKQFHALQGDGLLPIEICEQYEQRLRAQPLNLGFLGVGNNGHLAFNDPAVANFEASRWVQLVRLDEINRQQQASSTAFADINGVPQYAFTLTLSAIQNIEHLLCLAFGRGKATIVHNLLTGPITPRCPASILRKIPQSVMLIDTAAAELL